MPLLFAAAPTHRSALVTLIASLIVLAPVASAQEADIAALTPRILFAVSGGAWEDIPTEAAAETPSTGADEGASDGGTDGEGDAAAEAAPDEAMTDSAPQRGYYRAVAYRSEDNTSRLYLQRIALAEGGPETVETTEIAEITTLGAYITDLRPENSTGASSTPGFTAFVYLKRDPADSAADTWELFVDEFGAVTIDGATN